MYDVNGVRACVHACACVCVWCVNGMRACVSVCVCGVNGVRVCVRVCVRACERCMSKVVVRFNLFPLWFRGALLSRADPPAAA